MPVLTIECSEEVKAFLKEVAAREGKTLSDSIRDAAKAEAHKVLRKYKRVVPIEC